MTSNTRSNTIATTPFDSTLIRKFAPALTDPRAPDGLDSRLLMDAHGDLAIYYAPFEYLNPHARVVLVGITPGPIQMANAHRTVRQALMSGKGFEDAVRKAKEAAAFSGTALRNNLVSQLNHWGVHKWLGLADSAELFSSARELVQTTSLLRYPVFKAGKKYEGNPSMTRNPLLRKHLMEHFVKEVQQLPDAVFLSLGPKVQDVMHTLVAEGVLTGDQVITGMLHPSGENGYRIKYMLGDRAGSVPHRTNPLPYDQGHQAFRARYLSGRSGLPRHGQ